MIRIVPSSSKIATMAITRTGRLCTKRVYSSATADIAAEIQSRGPWYYHEPLAMAQINKLHTSFTGYIPKLTDTELAAGASLPLGYHLAFFNDVSPETELAGDGYHTAQAPRDEAKFPARMWLGGSVEFNPHAKHGNLTNGALASAKELIKSTHHSQKEISPGTTVERLDVTLDRLLYGADLAPADMDATNWALRETRSIAYFSPEAGANRKDTFTRHIKPPSGATYKLTLTPSNVLLFRYSALTFNSHRIHYDPYYSQHEEGLPDCVVHGPLSLSLVMSWLSSTVLPNCGANKLVRTFSYKNLLPMFVNQKMTLNAAVSTRYQDSINFWIENHNGSLTMSGSVKLMDSELP